MFGLGRKKLINIPEADKTTEFVEELSRYSKGTGIAVPPITIATLLFVILTFTSGVTDCKNILYFINYFPILHLLIFISAFAFLISGLTSILAVYTTNRNYARNYALAYYWGFYVGAVWLAGWTFVVGCIFLVWLMGRIPYYCPS